VSNSANSEDLNLPVNDPISPFQDGLNYEATLARVEAIMAQIEGGELELAEVFDRFTAAMDYLRQCETFLAQRQQQMDVLIETLTE
jgi:exodeoxyribonuclease VII small subunit